MAVDPTGTTPHDAPPTWVRVLLTELGLLGVVSVLLGAAITLAGRLGSAPPAPGAAVPATISAVPEDRAEVGDLDETRRRLDRATRVLGYATRYGIAVDLSAAIYDVAMDVGVHPELAYRLVKVESNFRRGAESHMNAVGLTQVRMIAAREYLPDATIEDLRHRETNLYLGLRYLRDLLHRFRGDLEMALVAYNRGPTLVDSIAASGGDPRNGYPDLVLAGVRHSVRAAPLIRRGS